MPSLRPDKFGKSGGGGGRIGRVVSKAKEKGVVVQGKLVAKRGGRMVKKMERDLLNEAKNTTRRAATASRHPSGFLIDKRDGTILNPKTMGVVRKATPANRVRARVGMVKNSPAARDVRKVAKKVSGMKKKRGK